MSDDVSTWADAIEHALASSGIRHFRRAVVLRETASTQDAAAREVVGGEPGAVVLAGRQTAGRGRLGRTWLDASGEGLAATFTLRAEQFVGAQLSLAAGIAAARAIDAHLPTGSAPTALRWPNDVVEPAPTARKIAGVLIEVRSGLSLVGIGINVGQNSWPAELASAAVSLRQLGSGATRLEVALRLLAELDKALDRAREALCEEWSQRNMLRGCTAVLEYRGERYAGRIDSLTPENELVLLDDHGRERRLPALHTSLVRFGAPA